MYIPPSATGRFTWAESKAATPTIRKPNPPIRIAGAVKRLRDVPRTQFSQGALYEIGSALSLFLVRNFAEEFRAALEGKPPSVPPVAQDESVAAVAEDIEEATRDFVNGS